MAKKMLIDATHAEETRVVVVDGTQVDEFDFETVNKRQLAGNIYLAKVTRVEPSLQAAFVDYGGNRHGFLAFAEIHPDYYQIPAEDRRALLEEERAAAAAAEAEEDAREHRANRPRRSPKPERARAESVGTLDAAIASEAIAGMELAEADPEDDTRDEIMTIGEDSSSDEEAVEVAFTEVDAPDASEADADAPEAEAEGDTPEARRDASQDDESIESVGEADVADDMPAPRKPRARRYKIQEVIKVRQIMLVQVVKEERGNKGAALTTYLSLAGRYCVLMPNTARGGGISRKITNAADRKKLKDIAGELEVPQGAGLIIRTAGSQRTRTEIRRDYEYLMRLWEQIRELTFRSIAPAPIYEEGDLTKRVIRDLYSSEIDEILVEGERGYRTARDFMAMIMPDQVRTVKHYTDPMPLFSRYQVESYLTGMFNPVVQLKSGGYIVIGITEALVAIDVNSGRATKEGSIEDTAYKTNCEAADEVARQLRLRDLAGLIVIDFIDMDERRNNAAVEKRFKDRLKTDRARIQVGRISGFGLLEMSRQRLRPGMLESTTQPCQHCHGTGLIRSDDSLALSILRGIEEEGTRKRSREVLVRAPVAVANFLINQKREHIALIEARTAMSVRIEADPALISPDWSLEKFKTATRMLAEPSERHALSVDASLMAAIDDEGDDDTAARIAAEAAADAADRAAFEAEAAAAAEGADVVGEAESDDTEDGGEDGGRNRRRRRRRRRGGRQDEAGTEGEGVASEAEPEIAGEDGDTDAHPAEAAASGEGDEGPRRRRRRVRGGKYGAAAEGSAAGSADVDEAAQHLLAPAPETAELDEQAGATGDTASGAASDEAATVPAEAREIPAETMIAPVVPDHVEASIEESLSVLGETPVEQTPAEQASVVAPVAPSPVPAPAPAANADAEPAVEEASPKPKRRGWWSFGA
ncbi:ribonuclease E/G [Paracoccus suum]|uniref:Ribonuclease E n=1 Tax=Paracoccus suum TaxID=2259340 RepID=A0A344PPA1_9RHOB|nr:ribonuclease E/G [Paracoccus suum]AXC51206.1 ribonuclease E/G [Paracoccus suum]